MKKRFIKKMASKHLDDDLVLVSTLGLSVRELRENLRMKDFRKMIVVFREGHDGPGFPGGRRHNWSRGGSNVRHMR